MMMKKENNSKSRDKYTYSTENRNHTKQDWINFRKGVEHCYIVPPPGGWVNEQRQHELWLERLQELKEATKNNIENNLKQENKPAKDNIQRIDD
jgi:hypothetical protein